MAVTPQQIEQVAAAGQAAAAYVEKKFGFPTRAILTQQQTIAVNPTRILQNNPRRILWAFFNNTTSSYYLWHDATVANQAGIIVPASGGSVIYTIDEDGELTTYEVWVYTQSASFPVSWLEVVRK